MGKMGLMGLMGMMGLMGLMGMLGLVSLMVRMMGTMQRMEAGPPPPRAPTAHMLMQQSSVKRYVSASLPSIPPILPRVTLSLYAQADQGGDYGGAQHPAEPETGQRPAHCPQGPLAPLVTVIQQYSPVVKYHYYSRLTTTITTTGTPPKVAGALEWEFVCCYIT